VTRWQGGLRESLPDFARFAPETFHICRPSAIAIIGLEKYQRNDTQDMVSIIPTYLRASEAELKKSKD
jgi:hypothetical protein